MMPDGALRRYFGGKIAMEEAARNQKTNAEPKRAEQHDLINAIRRYTAHDLSSKLSGSSVGYGAVRSDVSLDTIRSVLDSGSKLEAKLYDTKSDAYGAHLIPPIADRVSTYAPQQPGRYEMPVSAPGYTSGLETRVYAPN